MISSARLPSLTSLSTWEQFDWEPLRTFVRQNAITSPAIGIFGSGHQLQPASTILPWKRRGEIATAAQLWRFENGEPDFATIERQTREYSVLVTIRGYRGDARDRQHLDNEWNGHFDDRMRPNSEWKRTTLEIPGCPAEVVVYTRATS